jgi:WD40 repeat protein
MASSIGGSGGRRSGSGPAPAPAPGPGLGLGPGSGPGSGSHSAATPPPEPSGDFSEVSCRLLQGGHSKVVRGVAWNCTGELLGTGSADHTVRLWNADTLKMTTSLTGHTDYVESVCWDPTNERVLATTTANGEIRSWDSRMGRVAHKLQPATNEYNIDIKWSPNGYWLTTANKSCGVHMFDARMWKRAKRIKFPYAAVSDW